MSAPPFPDRPRIDAFDKVRGETAYAADLQFPGLLYAMTVPSPIARGTMTALPLDAAMRVRGVVRILTPKDFPSPRSARGDDEPPLPTLETKIAYRGQPVALVVAETLEAAIEGAEAIRPRFAPEPFAAEIDSPGATREPAKEEITHGDAARALAGATTIVEAAHESATQHHNPIELLSTTAVWSRGRLTIYESSQNSGGINTTLSDSVIRTS
jgi:xanthine dehydrogenase YagR molybdenum-binding subunit